MVDPVEATIRHPTTIVVRTAVTTLTAATREAARRHE
jgi:hypothetical protein